MSALSDIVAKFRAGSPNIAKAFDEVERRLVAVEGSVDRAWTELAEHESRLAALEDTPETPPPPPPPPTGQLLFDGLPNGQLSPAWNHDFSQGCVAVDSPAGRIMRAQTSGSTSMVNIGQTFEAYQLPWETIPSDVWHGFTVVIPDGTNPSYPGNFVPSTPGSGWDAIWELHNRTDGASGYVQGQTRGDYLSTMMTVKHEGGGQIRFQMRPAGGTLAAPVLTFFQLDELIQRNRPYRMAVRLKHGNTPQTGYFEWWVDGVKRHERAIPTAYICADGKSGERLQVGIYRGGFSGTTTVYIRPPKVGTTREIVQA